MKISKNKILITGGASGIGLGLTERFIKENNTVIICGRRESALHLASLFVNLKNLDTIINVTSGLSFAPIVKVPVYCASKAFLHSFTLSLRQLLKSNSIEVIELIPPALNTDLGGKGIHYNAQPVSEFIEAVFEQLKQGKTEITYGFSEAMTKSGPEDLKKAFARMNSQ